MTDDVKKKTYFLSFFLACMLYFLDFLDFRLFRLFRLWTLDFLDFKLFWTLNFVASVER